MFFVETLGESPLPEPGTPVRASEIAVRLTFHGEPAGSLTLHLSSAAASPIAADFLGADEESVTGQQTAEVVCELANMICGSVLSRVESAAPFHLSAPQIVPSLEQPGGPCTTRYAVEVANGTLTVIMTTGTPCLEPVQFAY